MSYQVFVRGAVIENLDVRGRLGKDLRMACEGRSASQGKKQKESRE